MFPISRLSYHCLVTTSTLLKLPITELGSWAKVQSRRTVLEKECKFAANARIEMVHDDCFSKQDALSLSLANIMTLSQGHCWDYFWSSDTFCLTVECMVHILVELQCTELLKQHGHYHFLYCEASWLCSFSFSLCRPWWVWCKWFKPDGYSG